MPVLACDILDRGFEQIDDVMTVIVFPIRVLTNNWIGVEELGSDIAAVPTLPCNVHNGGCDLICEGSWAWKGWCLVAPIIAEESIEMEELITFREMCIEGLIMESGEYSGVELNKTEVFAGLMTASVGISCGRRVLLWAQLAWGQSLLSLLYIEWENFWF